MMRMRSNTSTCLLWISILASLLIECVVVSFVPNHHTGYKYGIIRLQSTKLPEVSSMRASELKKELIDYGIDTKSFLEKSELIEAVEKARAQGKTPQTPTKEVEATVSSPTGKQEEANSQNTKLEQEMEMIQKTMKTLEIKKQLEDMGISTRAFLEKNEYIKALAEARIHGVQNTKSSSTRQQQQQSTSEGYAEYKNVEVLTSDAEGPQKRSQQQQSSRSNPFAGSSTRPSGAAGMDGFADMFKNMGMGGAGNPFGGASGNPLGGGAGGNPFGGMGGGDVAAKAQRMMQNPKVRDIFMKAQKNPKIMAAVTECMSNPAAFAKYKNDPTVGELIRELQPYL